MPVGAPDSPGSDPGTNRTPGVFWCLFLRNFGPFLVELQAPGAVNHSRGGLGGPLVTGGCPGRCKRVLRTSQGAIQVYTTHTRARTGVRFLHALHPANTIDTSPVFFASKCTVGLYDTSIVTPTIFWYSSNHLCACLRCANSHTKLYCVHPVGVKICENIVHSCTEYNFMCSTKFCVLDFLVYRKHTVNTANTFGSFGMRYHKGPLYT